MKYSLKRLRTIVVLPLLFSAGCVAASQQRYEPASHFIHPNSNMYRSTTPVRATYTSSIYWFIPPGLRTPETDQILYDRARVQAPGSDIIVDYVVTSELWQIPLLYVTLYFTTHEIEGYPARIVMIGDQDLE